MEIESWRFYGFKRNRKTWLSPNGDNTINPVSFNSLNPFSCTLIRSLSGDWIFVNETLRLTQVAWLLRSFKKKKQNTLDLTQYSEKSTTKIFLTRAFNFEYCVFIFPSRIVYIPSRSKPQYALCFFFFSRTQFFKSDCKDTSVWLSRELTCLVSNGLLCWLGLFICRVIKFKSRSTNLNDLFW